MNTTKWSDIKHKLPPSERERLKNEELKKFDSLGLRTVREARERTQTDVAEVLGLPQSSISDIERRDDLLLSTVIKYVRALGGELELRAVFKDGSFALRSDGSDPSAKNMGTKRTRHRNVA